VTEENKNLKKLISKWFFLFLSKSATKKKKGIWNQESEKLMVFGKMGKDRGKGNQGERSL
jgi:hypothetical protein